MSKVQIIKIDDLNSYLNEQINKIHEISHDTLLQYKENDARLEDIFINEAVISEFEKIDETYFTIHNILLHDKREQANE